MISQHLSGNRPISMEAAIAYAKGLGLPVSAISPRNAERIEAAARLGLIGGPSRTPATATADLEVGKSLTLERALPVVLARLPGLDRYTAAKVQGAIEAALQPGAPLERIERDLVQWLSEPAPRASDQVLSAKPSFETADIVKPRAERMP